MNITLNKSIILILVFVLSLSRINEYWIDNKVSLHAVSNDHIELPEQSINQHPRARIWLSNCSLLNLYEDSFDIYLNCDNSNIARYNDLFLRFCGRLKFHDGSIEEARIILSTIGDTNSLYEFAQHSISEKDYDLALDLFEDIYSNNPNFPKILYRISQIHYFKENYEKAIDYLLKQLDENPDHVWSDILLADCYSQIGRKDLSLKVLETSLNKHPENSYIYYELAWLYKEFKNEFKAIDSIRKAIALNEEEANLFRFYVRAAYLFEWIGDSSQAIQYFDKALFLNPNDEQIIKNINRLKMNE